jgi:predicted nucleotidyltransferase
MREPRTQSREAVLERLRGILQPHREVLEAYLFGSLARGETSLHSDVDVAVYVAEPRPELSAFGYRAELTAAVMAGLGCNEVDVVVLNDAPPLLYHRVLRDGVRILSRNLVETTTRAGRALSRYCDDLPRLEAVDRIASRQGEA